MSKVQKRVQIKEQTQATETRQVIIMHGVSNEVNNSSSRTKLRVYNTTCQYGFRLHNNRDGIIDFDPSTKRLFNLADKSGVGSEGAGIIAGTDKNLKVHVLPSFAENLLSVP